MWLSRIRRNDSLLGSNQKTRQRLVDSMIAAIYARKSTEHSGVASEQKSVSRQVEHARPYAARKGWMVDERFTFVDDGISGVEFANRP